jgi:hypothetical protein
MRGAHLVSKLLLVLAFAALALSLAVHSVTYFGLDPRAASKKLWYGLQATSILAFLLALIFFYRKGEADEASSSVPIDALDAAVVICFGLFWAYAIFNFLFTEIVLNEGALPRVVGGQHVLFTHGAVVRTLTEGEYARHLVYDTRAQSGHWMALYVTFIAVLYKQMRSRAT